MPGPANYSLPSELLKFVIYLHMLVTLAGCEPIGKPEPSVLRVSVLPDQAPEAVRAQHGPLIDYVCGRAELQCQWVDSSGYLDLVERFGRGEIDLAFFGGVTYVMAHEAHGALPLVMRDIDVKFSSGIFVRSADAARSLKELRGYSFAFGVAQSTSGHYMPRYFLNQAIAAPESFFSSIIHSRGHDDTLQRIARGDVDCGVANMQIARQLLQKDELKLRLVWETGPYTDYVWAVRPELSEELRLRLRDTFLSLRRNQQHERAILDLQGAQGFLPAGPEDFAELREIMRSIEPPQSGHRRQ